MFKHNIFMSLPWISMNNIYDDGIVVVVGDVFDNNITSVFMFMMILI